MEEEEQRGEGERLWGMRIASVEVIPYALPFREFYVTARGSLAQREMVLLRLRSDDGLTGLGEAVPMSLRGGATLARVVSELELLSELSELNEAGLHGGVTNLSASSDAVLIVTSLPKGHDSLRARYLGDANFAASTSRVLRHIKASLLREAATREATAFIRSPMPMSRWCMRPRPWWRPYGKANRPRSFPSRPRCT